MKKVLSIATVAMFVLGATAMYASACGGSCSKSGDKDESSAEKTTASITEQADQTA